MNPKYTTSVESRSATTEQFSRSQKSFLNLAMKTAEASECTQRHGAVLVKSGSVLSIGLNKWRNDVNLTHELFATGNISGVSIHAEMDALARVRNPAGAVLYIARVNKQGDPMMSKPCAACAKAIEEAGITKVVYTI